MIQGLKDEGKPAEEMLSKGYEAVDLYKCGYSHAEIQEGEEAFSGAPASTTDYICDLLKANLKLEGSKLKDHDREKLCRSATGLAVAVTFVLLFFGVAGFVSRTYRSGKMPKMDPFDDAGGDSIGMMINPMASPGLVSGSTAVVDSMANPMYGIAAANEGLYAVPVDLSLANPMYGIAEANQVLYAVPMDLKSNNNETKRRLGNPTNDTAAANEVLYAIPMDQEDDARYTGYEAPVMEQTASVAASAAELLYAVPFEMDAAITITSPMDRPADGPLTNSMTVVRVPNPLYQTEDADDGPMVYATVVDGVENHVFVTPSQTLSESSVDATQLPAGGSSSNYVVADAYSSSVGVHAVDTAITYAVPMERLPSHRNYEGYTIHSAHDHDAHPEPTMYAVPMGGVAGSHNVVVATDAARDRISSLV